LVTVATFGSLLTQVTPELGDNVVIPPISIVVGPVIWAVGAATEVTLAVLLVVGQLAPAAVSVATT
jgi:hypothetical protein